jgi:hypothetical protein
VQGSLALLFSPIDATLECVDLRFDLTPKDALPRRNRRYPCGCHRSLPRCRCSTLIDHLYPVANSAHVSLVLVPGLSPGPSLLGQSLPAGSSARCYSLGGRESAGLLRSVGPFDAARGSPLVHRPCWLAPRVSEGTRSFPSTQDSNFCCRSAIPFFSRSTGFPSRWLQEFAWLLLCGCAGRNPDSATRNPAFSLCTPLAWCLGAGQGEAMRSGLTSPAGIAPAWTNS